MLARLVAEVRGQVIAGKLAADQQLPTETVMDAEFGDSRPLLREALSELRAVAAARTLVGRLGTPTDIAQAVRYLASDESSFITGDVLRVNGGSLL